MAFILLASSCQLNSFTERPGVILKGYPEQMYGKYIFIEKSKNGKDTHVLNVDSTGVILEEPMVNKIDNIIDSNSSISHLGDFYYLNIKETDTIGNVTYYVYPFKFDDRHLYFWSLYRSDKEMKRMLKCGLKPSGRMDSELIMDNMPFKKYVEKYLRKRDAVRFKKIK